AGLGVLLDRKRKQQTFDGNIGIAGLLRRFLGRCKDARQAGIEIELTGAASAHLGALAQRVLDRGERRARVSSRAIDETSGEAFGIVEKDLEKVFRSELLVTFAQRQRLRRLNEPAGALGIFFKFHALLPQPALIALPARTEHLSSI